MLDNARYLNSMYAYNIIQGMPDQFRWMFMML